MQLVEINIVHTQGHQAFFYILGHPFFIPGHGFGGDDHLVSVFFQCCTEFFFTISVTPGGIKEVDAQVYGTVNNLLCTGCINPLDRNTAKTHYRYLQIRFPESSVYHLAPPV
jgi:hypothetical protein